jgi:hypothetical protein
MRCTIVQPLTSIAGLSARRIARHGCRQAVVPCVVRHRWWLPCGRRKPSCPLLSFSLTKPKQISESGLNENSTNQARRGAENKDARPIPAVHDAPFHSVPPTFSSSRATPVSTLFSLTARVQTARTHRTLKEIVQSQVTGGQRHRAVTRFHVVDQSHVCYGSGGTKMSRLPLHQAPPCARRVRTHDKCRRPDPPPSPCTRFTWSTDPQNCSRQADRSGNKLPAAANKGRCWLVLLTSQKKERKMLPDFKLALACRSRSSIDAALLPFPERNRCCPPRHACLRGPPNRSSD